MKSCVLPKHGLTLTHLRLLGEELLFFDPSLDPAYKSGAAFLFPFANRMQTDSMILLHGVLHETPVHVVSESATHVHAQALVSGCNIEIEYRLEKSRIHVWAKATNITKTSLPVAWGWHPYFRFRKGGRINTYIELSALKKVEVDTELLPTGKLLDAKECFKGLRLDLKNIDCCFTELKSSSVKIIDEKEKTAIVFTWPGKEMIAVHVYSPLNQDFVSVEPVQNLPDPLNTNVWPRGAGMKILAPNEEREYRVTVSLEECEEKKPT